MTGNVFTLWCLVIAQAAFRVVYVLLLPFFIFIAKNNVEDNSYNQHVNERMQVPQNDCRFECEMLSCSHTVLTSAHIAQTSSHIIRYDV